MPNAAGGDQLHPAYTGLISKDPHVVYSKKTELEYTITMEDGHARSISVESVTGRCYQVFSGSSQWLSLPLIVKRRIRKLEQSARKTRKK